jgi:hypothetical protein
MCICDPLLGIVCASHAEQARLAKRAPLGTLTRAAKERAVTEMTRRVAVRSWNWTPMPDYMTPASFAGKVDWEGGVFEALAWGLSHTHLNPDDPSSRDLRQAWHELETAYQAMRPLECRVDALLDDIEDEDDDAAL